MKIGRRDRDMLRFEDGIGDRMAMGQIIISSSYQSHDLRNIKQYLFALKTSLIGALACVNWG